jgi:hypothetical protein
VKKKVGKESAELHPSQNFVIERTHRRQIKNAEYNPRVIDDHARKKLKGNLKKMGLIDPLVWNRRTGNLVSGHQRISILDDLAGTNNYTLDFAVVDLSLEDEKVQNVFLNNPDAQGTYDVDVLGKMIVNDEIDYKRAGFDDMSLQIKFEGTEFAVTMFDKAPKSVKDDLEQLAEIQRMKRERKEHRERDQDENDPDFYAVVVFPDREAQSRFMERVGGDRNDRYVDGPRLHSALEAVKPRTKTKNGEEFEAMTFWVAEDQKHVIESELTRLAALLGGKNIRGRALEAMAVISSQTPTDNITGEEPADDATHLNKKRKKVA